jgi:hypothetical protein
VLVHRSLYLETEGLADPVVLLLAAVVACSGPATTPPAEPGFPVTNPAAVPPATPPASGPWYHTVRTATSSDGLTFRDERTADLVEHGSVPAALSFPDGTLRVYFVDFSSGNPERLGCVESRDNGVSYRWGGCAIAGLQSVKAVDPCPVLLEDGRVRLYFYASDANVNSTGPHRIDTAISSDGVLFTREGAAFTAGGLVDPDVFFNGSTWIMHVFSLAEGGTVVATSGDGLSFQRAGLLSPRNYGVTRPVRLPDGRFRMYGFHQPDATDFVSLISADGLAWTLESGTRFGVPTGYQITDPYVIARPNGGWFMTYKREKR